MESPFIPKCFLLFLCCLLVLPSMWHSSDVTGNAPVKVFRGVVGGNVTFECPYDPEKPIQFLYLQRGDIFVNGFYKGKNVTNNKVKPWENTKVNDEDITVDMSNLNLTHNGTYTCIVMYSDDSSPNSFLRYNVLLIVTAKYSQPNLTVIDGSLTCTSHGGYPKAQITWNPPGRLEVTENRAVEDPYTSLFNLSSSAKLNCSSGRVENVSCSVGNLTSDTILICTKEDPPQSPSFPMIIVAISVALGITIVSAIVIGLYCRRKKRQRTESLSDTTRTAEERVGLNEVNGRGGAP